MSRDRIHLRIITRDDRPYTPEIIVPLIPPGREIEILSDHSDDWIDNFFAAIEDHRCPECACEMERVVQVGHMIDALPCGHRLGIGKAWAFAAAYDLAVAEG